MSDIKKKGGAKGNVENKSISNRIFCQKHVPFEELLASVHLFSREIALKPWAFCLECYECTLEIIGSPDF
jgi:hypothetical protein